MQYICEHCGQTADRPAGHVNRSRANGMALYCGRRCMGLARRLHRSKAELVESKRLYDIAYRKRNAAELKVKRAAYHKRTYDPVTAAAKRKDRMPYHVAYCRRPAYVAKKSAYDRNRRALLQYGPASDAFLALQDLTREIKGRMSNYEIKRQNETFGKRQARSREAHADKAARNRNRSA